MKKEFVRVATKEFVHVAASDNSSQYALNLYNKLSTDPEIQKKFEVVGHIMPTSQPCTAEKVASIIGGVVEERKHRGIIVADTCGRTVMYASIFPHIRATVAIDKNQAERMRRERLFANVIAIPSTYVPLETGYKIIKAFLMAEPTIPQDQLKREITAMTRRFRRNIQYSKLYSR